MTGGDAARRVLAGSDPVAIGRRLLGATLTRAPHGLAEPDGNHGDGGGTAVLARVVEVEAYHPDEAAAHSHRGRTARNAVMFGPPGHLYVYRSHGLHWCVNVVTGPVGLATAVLLRAAVVLDGHGVVRARRAVARRAGAPRDHELLRGPGNLGRGLDLDAPRHDGLDLLAPASALRLDLPPAPVASSLVRRGPRVGVTHAADLPWRLWLDGEPSVSAYRRGVSAPAVSPRAPG